MYVEHSLNNNFAEVIGVLWQFINISMAANSYDDFKNACTQYARTNAQTEIHNAYAVREDCITRYSSLRKVGKMPCATVKLNNELESGATFFMPMWNVEQEKLSFLPSMLSMAIQNSCRLVLLFDSCSDWSTIEKIRKQTTDPRRPAHVDMNLQDVAFDVTVEKEVHPSTKNSGVVLSWIRSGEMFSIFQNEATKATNCGVTVHGNRIGSSSAEEAAAAASKANPSSVDYDPFTGYRCAFLRCESLYHACGFESSAAWNGFNELYSLACAEIAAAYGQLSILCIDVGGGMRLSSKNLSAICATQPTCPRPPHYYWGVGNRGGLIIALDAAIVQLMQLLKSRNREITVRPITAVELENKSEIEAVGVDVAAGEEIAFPLPPVPINLSANTSADDSVLPPPALPPPAPPPAESTRAASSGIECVVLDPFHPPTLHPAGAISDKIKAKYVPPRTAAISSVTISRESTDSGLQLSSDAAAAAGILVREEAKVLTEKLLEAVDNHTEYLEQGKAQAQERLRARMANRKLTKKGTVPSLGEARASGQATGNGGDTTSLCLADGTEVSSALPTVDVEEREQLPLPDHIDRMKRVYRASNFRRDLSFQTMTAGRQTTVAGRPSLQCEALSAMKAILSASGSEENQEAIPEDEVLWEIHCIIRNILLELGYISPDLFPTNEQYAFIVRQLASIANNVTTNAS